MGYGKGWTKFKEEFNEVFRGLTQLGYAVFFIGHEKETITEENGVQVKTVRPAISSSIRIVITGMADIYGYAHEKYKNEMSVLTLRCPDGSIECGSRFKYLPEEIPTDYKTLVKVLGEAIDKEAAEHGNEFVTDDKMTPVITEKTYDFEGMKKEFNDLVSELMTANQSNAAKITAIVEKYLGRGRKVSDCNQDQSEHLELIIADLKEMRK